MSDIFLCYSRTDADRASQLEQRLTAEGWSVFRDIRTHVGKRWHEEIEKELHAARAVVVLWSEKSRDSDYVLEEAQYGKDKGILFPAFIEEVEFPYGFRRIQTANLIGWSGAKDHAGLDGLLQALREHLGQGVPPSPQQLHGAAEQLNGPASPTLERVFAPGETFRDRLKVGGEGPLMVVIPVGRFLMGSASNEPERSGDEGPQHPVTIPVPFAMGVYAVTFEDYDKFCVAEKRALPDDAGWGRRQRPVINVSWHDAQAYCAWLSQQTGQTYRLPSEAEWEYACRAGTNTPFHCGEQITTSQANFDGNYTYNGSAKGEYRQQTLPVGSFAPNALGLYDTHGNVWEWCQDAWHNNYAGAPDDGSAWEVNGTGARVRRGGSWHFNPRLCRAAYRLYYFPDYASGDVGFRVCRVAPID